MDKKILIIYIPVIHKGYLDFLRKNAKRISCVYLINKELLENLSEFEPDIAYLESNEVRSFLETFGIQNISILSADNIKEIKNNNLILINDEISRNLYNKYFKKKKVDWVSVFLRWDKDKILCSKPLDNILISDNDFDIKMIKETIKESEKSSEWWRRIGAVLVKNKRILIKANNKDIPSDHTPYQFGEPRDFFKPGERQDIASTIHAEQKIIAYAAKEGISVANSSIYVNTFPCPVCAKIIACSGIKSLYFAEGGSNFDARKVLESAGVKLVHVL